MDEPYVILMQTRAEEHTGAALDKTAYVRQQQERVRRVQELLDQAPDDEGLQDDLSDAQALLNLLVEWAADSQLVARMTAEAADATGARKAELLGKLSAISGYKLDGPPHQ